MGRATALGEAVTLLRAALVSGVWQRMTDYADGPATRPLDAPARNGGAISDPTATAALRTTAAMGANHRLEFEMALNDARHALRRALAIAALYPARDAHALVTLAKGDPGCENCARTKGPSGAPRFELVHPKLLARTTVGGRLARPLYLCRWCYDRVILWDRLPTTAELTAHHNGRRVPWPADVPRPQEAAG